VILQLHNKETFIMKKNHLFALLIAGVISLNANADDSKVSFEKSEVAPEWGTLRIEGPAAQSLYDHINVEADDGIKNADGIACVAAGALSNTAAYCSLSVENTGRVEGDRIGRIDPRPSVSGSKGPQH